MSDLSDEELTRNMMALHDGMTEIGKKYDEHVFLALEDPVTFGAGHYVFYPLEGHSPRLAITEQYSDGVDWSDDDRIPTSWTWESEARVPDSSGGHTWTTVAEGEIPSADYQKLLRLADEWSLSVYRLAERQEALTADPISRDEARREGPGRTFLA